MVKKIFRLKNLLILVLAFVSALSFTACAEKPSNNNPPETGDTLTVNQAVITLKPYETFDIIATYTGEESLSWATDTPSVATVDNGRVTAVSVGKAVITVTAGKLSKKCYVTVESNNEVPTLVVSNADDGVVKLNVSDLYTLNAIVKFSNQTVEATLNFASSNEEIVSVDKNGKLTANAVGEAYIFITGAWREFDGEDINTSVKVIVKEQVSFSLKASASEIYAVSELDGETLVNASTVVPTLTINGQSITDGFTFASSNLTIATIDENGVVTGKKVGETEITCYYQHGEQTLFAKYTIKVLPIIKDKVLEQRITVELSTSPTTEIFSQVFGNSQIVSIKDVTDTEFAIGLQDGAIVNDQTLVTGERKWEIHTDAFAYRLELLIVDYVITTAEQIKTIFPSIQRDAYIVLGNNINNVGDYSGWNTFAGTLDGQGYVISDINIKDRGLFGLLTAGATIKNLGISNVTLSGTSGVFGVQADSATIDNVSVWITGVTPTDTIPCGGLVFQVGGTLNVRNTLVYAMGVEGVNFGAVVGAWWSGTCEIVNSYFITDGTPFGKVYKTSGVPNENEKGVAENAKGSWNYVFQSKQAFESALASGNGVNLNGFDGELWNLSTTTMPVFKNDIGFSSILSEQVKGAKSGGELFFFSKNVTTPTGYGNAYVVDGKYNFTLPEGVKGDLTALYLGSTEIKGFGYLVATRTVKIPTNSVADIVSGQNSLLIITNLGSYSGTVTVADYVIYDSADVNSVLNSVTNEYIVLDRNIVWGNQTNFTRTATNYNGTFDGKGYYIKDMKLSKSLFSTLQPGAIIRNLALIEVSNFAYNGGTIAGDISRDILVENVLITVSVSGGSFGMFGRLAVTGAPVTIKNSIIAFEYQNATIANYYKAGVELVMENSYIVSSKLPFNSDLGEEDTKNVYDTAKNATYSDVKGMLTASNNLQGFSSLFTADSRNNLYYNGVLAIVGSGDIYSEDIEWIPETELNN